MGVGKRLQEKSELKAEKANLLAALVDEWGQKRCAAPATSAAEFVNAGMPVCQIYVMVSLSKDVTVSINLVTT